MSLVSALCVVLPLFAVRAQSAQQRIVLVGATLLDGTGVAPVVRSRIAIVEGRFVCLSGPDGCPAQAGDRAIDVSGSWITPGLIDTHVHLPLALVAKAGLERTQRLRFALGITTVRDAGSRSTEELLAARAQAEEGSRPIPRLVVASLATPDDVARSGVDANASVVSRLAAAGVDAIKIKEPFTNEDWRGQIRAARAAGLPAFGHTWGGVNEVFTRQAIAEGISGISHIMAIAPGTQPHATVLTPPDSVKDFWPWEKALWLTIDSTRLDSLVADMVSGRVWLEPTLTMEYHFGRAIDPPIETPFLRQPPSLRDVLYRRGGKNAAVAPSYPDAWRRQAAFVGDFVRRGGMVVAGSDGKAPGIDLHEEMWLIGDVTDSRMKGLQAATRNAAIALNRIDVGTIENGKLADAVVYSADPLSQRWASLRITSVLKGGVVHDARDLRMEFETEYAASARAVWRGRAIRLLPLLAAALLSALAIMTLWRRRRRAHGGNVPT